jgi:hypothetical protein
VHPNNHSIFQSSAPEQPTWPLIPMDIKNCTELRAMYVCHQYSIPSFWFMLVYWIFWLFGSRLMNQAAEIQCGSSDSLSTCSVIWEPTTYKSASRWRRPHRPVGSSHHPHSSSLLDSLTECSCCFSLPFAFSYRNRSATLWGGRNLAWNVRMLLQTEEVHDHCCATTSKCMSNLKLLYEWMCAFQHDGSTRS